MDDFLYLGSYISSSEHDFKVRKTKAGAACHQMKKIWSFNLRRNLKIRLFIVTIEPILLYSSETWTITASLSKRIDGCYTRMLRMALNINWRDMVTNIIVYGDLPRVTDKIRDMRMTLAGHIHWHEDLVAHEVLFCDPQHESRGRGRPRLT